MSFCERQTGELASPAYLGFGVGSQDFGTTLHRGIIVEVLGHLLDRMAASARFGGGRSSLNCNRRNEKQTHVYTEQLAVN